MPLIQVVNLQHAYGADVILAGATISIESGERIGLVGRNGTGKSTLMRAIAGLLPVDSGSVQMQKGARVGYLKQDPELPPDATLRDAAEEAFAELHRLHGELHTVYDEMADAQGDALNKLMRRQEQLDREIESAGGYAIDHKIDATLHGLGFTDSQFTVKCRDLSGGQRSRLALARLLLEQPDLILLDEPTNHLDIGGRIWLENFLRDEFPGAVLMVSHDRRLLENVVTRIVEVEQGRLIDYPGSYTTFRKLRFERRLTQQRAYEKQQTEFKRQEHYIQRYKTGQRAKEARGRQKKLERAKSESIEKPLELDTFRLQLPKAPRSGDIVVTARGLSKRYTNVKLDGAEAGEKVLFHDFEVKIGRGERWGIIGPNGAGKTTLVGCLLGSVEANAGSVRLGSNVVVGYFKQDEDTINPDRPLYRHLQDIIKKENPDRELSEQQARDLAGAFLFSGDEQDKEMGMLSGGERARVRLAGLLASAKNLLVLDEPTNHLDIPSAERLEESLTADGGFEGTLLLISHDRALIDATCDHLIVLDGEGGARITVGNYSDWRARQDERDAARLAPAEPTNAKPRKNKSQKTRQTDSSGGPMSHLRMEDIESRIETIELRLGEIDAELNDPDVWKDLQRATGLTSERESLQAELEPLEEEWSRRAEVT